MEKAISRILATYEEEKISRRGLIAGLVALSPTTRSTQASTFKGTSLNHVALNVTDVHRSRAFYQKHFGLPVVRESENVFSWTWAPTFWRCSRAVRRAWTITA